MTDRIDVAVFGAGRIGTIHAGNLARHAGVDFSQALRHANAKFERRFRQMEQLAAAEGAAFAERTLDEQEQLWQRAKQAERTS